MRYVVVEADKEVKVKEIEGMEKAIAEANSVIASDIFEGLSWSGRVVVKSLISDEERIKEVEKRLREMGYVPKRVIHAVSSEPEDYD